MTARAQEVRLATSEDASELTALIQSAYRGDSSRTGWTTEADLLDGPRTDVEAVRAVIADPRSMLLVFPDDKGVLACCQLEDRGGEGLVYFGMFAVRPGQQGGGVGRRVMAEAQQQARAVFGSTLMEMTVIAQRHELIAWYERLGFAVTAETRPFPYGDPRAGSPRRDDLYFTVLRKDITAEAQQAG